MTRPVQTHDWKSSPWLAGPRFAAYRQGRFIIVELEGLHRAATTSANNGGIDAAVRHLVNHQSCEAREHADRYAEIAALGPEGYHDAVCKELALDPASTAVMGTAANMIYAAHEAASFGDVRVDAIVTAGVDGNAVCAGDPAEWIETPGGWNKTPKAGGTINTIVVVNEPLRPEAQIRALITITEGKSAALMELGVASRYSQDLATGTGTDQICLASPVAPDRYAYASASPHTKLGEMLGRATRAATKHALRWQNGLEPSLTRSLVHALRRFGFTEAAFLESLQSRLDAPSARLLEKNKNAVLYEPQVAAAAYAFAGVLDRIRFGVLPASSAREVLRHQAATMAASLGAAADRWFEFYRRIDVKMDRPLDAVYDALALGWAAKWESTP